MFVMETAEERVAAGAEWLDAAKPEWPTLVNRETLDLASCGNCILGQVFAEEAEAQGYGDGYTMHLDIIGWDHLGIVADRGFAGVNPEDYVLLHTAWLAELNRRG